MERQEAFWLLAARPKTYPEIIVVVILPNQLDLQIHEQNVFEKSLSKTLEKVLAMSRTYPWGGFNVDK